MDYIRQAMIRPMWFAYGIWDGVPLTPAQVQQGYYLEGNQLRRAVLVRWYKAPPGALPFPAPHIYGSTVWTNQYETNEQQLGEVPPGVTPERVAGNLASGLPNPKWCNANLVPLGADGQHFCGQLEWFQGAVPDGGPVRGPGGLPACCNPGLGAAVGFGRGLALRPANAALGLAGLNVGARLELLGRVPALARLGLSGVNPAALARFGIAAASIPETAIGVGGETPAAAPVGLSQPVVGGRLRMFVGDAFAGWAISPQWHGSGAPELDIHTTAGDGTLPALVSLVNYRYYHISAGWDGATMQLWIDGVDQGTMPWGGTLAGTVGGWNWNAAGGGLYGDGSLTAVRAYGRLLTTAEVQADMGGAIQPGAINAYACTEGAGLTVHDSVGGNDVTLSGAPTWALDGPNGGGITFASATSDNANAVDDITAIGKFTLTLWYRPAPP